MRDGEGNGGAPDRSEDGPDELLKAGLEGSPKTALGGHHRGDHSPETLGENESGAEREGDRGRCGYAQGVPNSGAVAQPGGPEASCCDERKMHQTHVESGWTKRAGSWSQLIARSQNRNAQDPVACMALAASPSGIPPWSVAPLLDLRFQAGSRRARWRRTRKQVLPDVADHSLREISRPYDARQVALEQSHTGAFRAHPPTSSHRPDAALVRIASRVKDQKSGSRGINSETRSPQSVHTA